MPVIETGNTDIFTSRRGNFLECKYWHLDEELLKFDRNEIVYKRNPTGRFLAKQENEFVSENMTVAGSFMFDSNNVTISTRDCVNSLKQNDLVLVNGIIYRVSYIRRKPLAKNLQYMKELRYTAQSASVWNSAPSAWLCS